MFLILQVYKTIGDIFGRSVNCFIFYRSLLFELRIKHSHNLVVNFFVIALKESLAIALKTLISSFINESLHHLHLFSLTETMNLVLLCPWELRMPID